MLSVSERWANTSLNCSYSAAILPVILNFGLKFQIFSCVRNKLNGKKIKLKGLSCLKRDSFTLSKQHIFRFKNLIEIAPRSLGLFYLSKLRLVFSHMVVFISVQWVSQPLLCKGADRKIHDVLLNV